MTALLMSSRAELLRLRHWPAVWVMLGAWLVLNITFVYVFPYLSYRSDGDAGPGGAPSDELLADLLPAAVPVSVVQGMPMFGGAILLTLGALTAGSGYGWGTWKTTFTQGPGRLATTGGMIVALTGVVVSFVVVTFVVDLGIASALGAVEGQGFSAPPIGEIAVSFVSGILILEMWMVAGVAIGTLARGPALAVGLGVVWVLAVENLLRGVGELLDWLQPVTDVLPGTVAGSIAADLGATPVSSDGGTPGVVAVLDGGPATALAISYLSILVLMIFLTVRRRDVN